MHTNAGLNRTGMKDVIPDDAMDLSVEDFIQ